MLIGQLWEHIEADRVLPERVGVALQPQLSQPSLDVHHDGPIERAGRPQWLTGRCQSIPSDSTKRWCR